MSDIADEEIQWLKSLQGSLWPPKERWYDSPVSMKTFRELTFEEWGRVRELIEGRGLLTMMKSVNMFGGYGMEVYLHPVPAGAPPVKVLLIHEDNLPSPTRIQRAASDAPLTRPERVPGAGRDDAWKLFSRYTHSAHNRQWLKYYHLEPPQERSHYDY
jgi:hypothetical protein